MESTDLVSSVLKIIGIDLVLSGDNAVVIGMVAARLGPRERRTALLVGGAAAIALRITLTVVAASILTIPVLQLVGGLLLVAIAFRILRQEEEADDGVRPAIGMREAIATIFVANLVMSLDNVLGVAAASNGDVGLLGFGLLFSMAILLFMGGLVASLIDRVWWLAYAATGLIAWTGAEMIFEDRFVHAHVALVGVAAEYPAVAAITAATLGLAHWYHRVGSRGQPPADGGDLRARRGFGASRGPSAEAPPSAHGRPPLTSAGAPRSRSRRRSGTRRDRS
jgi:YjbE family integral membrane protein